MFYRKGRTAGYISVNHFRFEHILFDHFVCFFKAKFQSSQLQSFFGRDMLNKYNMFSKSKINVSLIGTSILTKIIVIMIFPII